MGKKPFCVCFIAVHLPKSGAFAAVVPVLDKAAHILGRIAEEKSDLVRELFSRAEAPDELRQTFCAAAFGISCPAQKLRRQRILKIAAQTRGPVEIEQCASVRNAERQQAKALRRQRPVDPPDLGQQRCAAYARTGKQASSLDPGKRRRALPDQQFF